MSDLIIIAEMLETVLLDESMRERVLDAMDFRIKRQTECSRSISVL